MSLLDENPRLAFRYVAAPTSTPSTVVLAGGRVTSLALVSLAAVAREIQVKDSDTGRPEPEALQSNQGRYYFHPSIVAARGRKPLGSVEMPEGKRSGPIAVH
jgi:hypothetical protein